MLEGIRRQPRHRRRLHRQARRRLPDARAHRNGGRTDFGTFAKAWDAFTGAEAPAAPRPREVRTLRGYLEVALIRDGYPPPDSGWTALAIRDPLGRTRPPPRRSATCRPPAAASPRPRPGGGVTIEELVERSYVEARAIGSSRSPARLRSPAALTSAPVTASPNPLADSAPQRAQPYISVVVPVRNGEAMIADCIAPSSPATTRPSREILVVDNASTDARKPRWSPATPSPAERAPPRASPSPATAASPRAGRDRRLHRRRLPRRSPLVARAGPARSRTPRSAASPASSATPGRAPWPSARPLRMLGAWQRYAVNLQPAPTRSPPTPPTAARPSTRSAPSTPACPAPRTSSSACASASAPLRLVYAERRGRPPPPPLHPARLLPPAARLVLRRRPRRRQVPRPRRPPEPAPAPERRRSPVCARGIAALGDRPSRPLAGRIRRGAPRPPTRASTSRGSPGSAFMRHGAGPDHRYRWEPAARRLWRGARCTVLSSRRGHPSGSHHPARAERPGASEARSPPAGTPARRPPPPRPRGPPRRLVAGGHPHEDDLGHEAVGRGAQQEPHRLGQVFRLDHLLRRVPAPSRTRSSACPRTRGRAPSPGSPARRPPSASIGSTPSPPPSSPSRPTATAAATCRRSRPCSRSGPCRARRRPRAASAGTRASSG